jgi:predicted CoA-binding protein
VTDPGTVAIIGASNNRRKYGNKAVRAFAARGYTVYASVRDVAGDIGMATFYVPPEVGLRVIDEIAARGIAEVWLNPGSESEALVTRSRALGIEPILACSIVGIGMSPDDL